MSNLQKSLVSLWKGKPKSKQAKNLGIKFSAEENIQFGPNLLNKISSIEINPLFITISLKGNNIINNKVMCQRKYIDQVQIHLE